MRISRPAVRPSASRPASISSCTLRFRSESGASVANIIPSLGRPGMFGPLPIPTEEKSPSVSGCESIHASSCARNSRATSSVVPCGASVRTITMPSSEGGKNSVESRDANPIAATNAPSARPNVAARCASVQSSARV